MTLYAVMFGIMFLCECFFVCVAIAVMRSQGTQQKLRAEITRKFSFTLVFYAIQVTEVMVYTAHLWKHDTEETVRWLKGTSLITPYVAGISTLILVFIRATEPTIWQELKTFFTCSKPSKRRREVKTLTSFLNSSINVEYVVLILEGISSVAKHRELLGNDVLLNESELEAMLEGNASDQFVQIVDAEAN